MHCPIPVMSCKAYGFGTPTATQDFVEGNAVVQRRHSHLDECLFCLEQRPLRVHHGEVVDPTVPVLQVEQRECSAGALRLCLRGAQLLFPGSAAGKRIGHFAEGLLDGFPVLGGGDLAIDFGCIQVGLIRAEVEDRHGDLWGERPGARGFVEQVRQAGTGPAERAAAVADIQYAEGESRIERCNRQRRITVDANLSSGSLGQALDAILALPTFSELPAGVQRIDYGESEYMEEMFGSFAVAMSAGILAMFAILVLLFRDFLQPLTILCTLPLSLIGAIPALWLIGASLDLPAIIGMLMLMGIVTKNAILLVDFTINGMKEGLTRHGALMTAGAARARPIVMTTVAMVAGMIPAAIGFGADSGFRIPMAVTVIGGLATSTLLSLICVPVGFAYLDDLRRWLGPRLARLTTVSEEDLTQD